MTRAEVLKKAEKIVCNDRENQYGSPENNFEIIAKLWSTYLGTPIMPKDVAMMMALLKIARIRNGKHKDDNYIDLAGYAACGCELGSYEPTKDINITEKKPKFRLEDYLDEECCMHCKNEKEARIFLDFLLENGRKWNGGNSYKGATYWKVYEKDTCYYFNTGQFGNVLCSKNALENALEFNNFDWSDCEKNEHE